MSLPKLTLDEAIRHCEEVANEQNHNAAEYNDHDEWEFVNKCACEQCAADHLQLAEWLKEYKELKAMISEWRDVGNDALGLVREYKEDYKNAIKQLEEAKRLLKLANSDAKSLFWTSSKCKYCSVAHNKEKCAEGVLCVYQGQWRYADEIDAFLEEEGDE